MTFAHGQKGHKMGKLIDADLATRAFDSLFPKVYIDNVSEPINQDWVDNVIRVINDLPSAQPEKQWISVSERLPKDSEYVLITIRRLKHIYNQRPFISVGYIGWNNTAWWCAHDGWCDLKNIEVLAWMPLPQPYQAERRENE